MKLSYIYSSLLVAVLIGGSYTVAACSDDTPKGKSIFPNTAVERNAFDKWLVQNYANPYNIEYTYRLRDIDTETNYNVTPADSAKATKLAIIFKYLWLDAYAEVAGADFVKANAPRSIIAIGSPGINAQGLQTAASAEGGYTVRVYRVNDLDQTILADQDQLTEYYFHTIHHEFTHILHQKKPYPVAYDQISKADYLGSEWIRKNEIDALRAGFISPYSMENGGEDIAELQSYYITTTPQKWEEKLNKAGKAGRTTIENKLEILRSYLKNSWNIDLDQLRDAVLRRTHQVPTLDLNHLN